jgi:hypothetical protein
MEMKVFGLMLMASIAVLTVVTGLSILFFWAFGVSMTSLILWVFGLAVVLGVAEGSNPNSPM